MSEMYFSWFGLSDLVHMIQSQLRMHAEHLQRVFHELRELSWPHSSSESIRSF